jgi:hypothetical protein
MSAEFLIPITFFLAIFGIVYVVISARNRERLAMIEKGVSPSSFMENTHRKRTSIRLGMLSVGIALGILAGQMIGHFTIMHREPATFSMIFLFGGLALVVEHYLAKKDK